MFTGAKIRLFSEYSKIYCNFNNKFSNKDWNFQYFAAGEKFWENEGGGKGFAFPLPYYIYYSLPLSW